MTIHALALIAALALPGSPAAGGDSGSQTVDHRWTPWYGCWQLLDESVENSQPSVARLMGIEPSRSPANSGALVCVTPAEEGGATLTTIVNDRAVLTETIVADGRRTELTERDCQGWQRAEWSPRGAWLYASAEISCQAQSPRRVSGMTLMIAGPTWIDIQLVETDGRQSLRVRRYVRAADQTHARLDPAQIERAPTMPLGTSFSLADVKEASGKVAAETLEAALVELKAGFDLDSRRLIELDEAGVPQSIIDLMVALSFPERFVVERRASGGGFAGWWPTGYDPLWLYDMQPYYYSSYYAPFGYRHWGGYNSYYFSGPGFVVLDPGSPNGLEPSGDGRVVDGRGYTRVRRNNPDPATPRGGGGWSTASGSSSSSGSSGSSGGGVSSSGYSSGGGGGGGRTAQPRPPGQ